MVTTDVTLKWFPKKVLTFKIDIIKTQKMLDPSRTNSIGRKGILKTSNNSSNSSGWCKKYSFVLSFTVVAQFFHHNFHATMLQSVLYYIMVINTEWNRDKMKAFIWNKTLWKYLTDNWETEWTSKENKTGSKKHLEINIAEQMSILL